MGLAAFFYSLASRWARAGGQPSQVRPLLEKGLELIESELAAGGLAGFESAMACRISFHLAMMAGQRSEWGDAARWLQASLAVDGAMSVANTQRAIELLADVHARGD